MTWLLSVYLLNGKWATNLPQDKVRMLRQGVEVDIDILQQGCKGGPLRGGAPPVATNARTIRYDWRPGRRPAYK